jgi:hypothetical protein
MAHLPSPVSSRYLAHSLSAAGTISAQKRFCPPFVSTEQQHGLPGCIEGVDDPERTPHGLYPKLPEREP